MPASVPPILLTAALHTAAVTLLLCVLLWLLYRADRWLAARLSRAVEPHDGTWGGQMIRVTRLHGALRHIVALTLSLNAVLLVYMWFAFVLRRFPATRPWGEALRAALLARLETLGGGIVDAVPGLLTVLIILAGARVASKAAARLFAAAEQERLSVPGVYPDTAAPMRRLVSTLLWLCALAMAYPYIPGSESSGFKGISVFVGVVVSLGSTGVVQHLMSGLMLTFARAVHVGDFARVGGVEGTVVEVGTLATKVRTAVGELVTIPNAVVVAQTLTNYSNVSGEPALVATSVTIGYDTPWRQVEALLLAAAHEAPGVRHAPPPRVWRAALEDYYVKYTLLVAPEDPCARAVLLDRLHVHILDVFNEHGVQIMSPHYVADPGESKVVPPSRWHAAPATAASPVLVSASPPAVSEAQASRLRRANPLEI